MSAAIAGPASIAANAMLPSKICFIATPPEFPVSQLESCRLVRGTITRPDADGCDIWATMEWIRTVHHSAQYVGSASHAFDSIRPRAVAEMAKLLEYPLQ